MFSTEDIAMFLHLPQPFSTYALGFLVSNGCCYVCCEVKFQHRAYGGGCCSNVNTDLFFSFNSFWRQMASGLKD